MATAMRLEPDEMLVSCGRWQHHNPHQPLSWMLGHAAFWAFQADWHPTHIIQVPRPMRLEYAVRWLAEEIWDPGNLWHVATLEDVRKFSHLAHTASFYSPVALSYGVYFLHRMLPYADRVALHETTAGQLDLSLMGDALVSPGGTVYARAQLALLGALHQLGAVTGVPGVISYLLVHRHIGGYTGVVRARADGSVVGSVVENDSSVVAYLPPYQRG